jgi:SAM-dependent methyltransferase
VHGLRQPELVDSGMDLDRRSGETEILDGPEVPNSVRELCYRDLARMHRWLGNWNVIFELLRRDPRPVRSVLDIGCGHGALAHEMHRRLGVTAIGVDSRPPERANGIRIIRANAVRDRLPQADAAVSLMLAHHLSEGDLAALIRNVGQSCRRFVILDLVRARIPIVLFRAFVAPWVNPINVTDGVRSIERSYTVEEMARLVAATGVTFRHHAAPLGIRQIVDIRYER